MKKVIAIAALLIGSQVMAQKEDSLVMVELTPVCSNMDSISTLMGWKMAGAKIDKVKAKYPANWIPAYYSAYAAIQMTYFDEKATPKVKDTYLDKADEYLTVVKATCPLKDEIYVLTAMIANARLAVDPQSRWKEYGKIFDDNLELAKKENENNPHIYLAKGFSVYYTPKMFGGGAKNAYDYFKKSEEKFKLITTYSLDKPYWGFMSTTYMIGECEKEIKK